MHNVLAAANTRIHAQWCQTAETDTVCTYNTYIYVCVYVRSLYSDITAYTRTHIPLCTLFGHPFHALCAWLCVCVSLVVNGFASIIYVRVCIPNDDNALAELVCCVTIRGPGVVPEGEDEEVVVGNRVEIYSFRKNPTDGWW